MNTFYFFGRFFDFCKIFKTKFQQTVIKRARLILKIRNKPYLINELFKNLEIDAACELIDFLRFNVQFLYEALKYKPLDAGDHTTNNIELRGIEGFVAAVAPFNFTAIGGNLSTAPALMGIYLSLIHIF